MAKKSKSHGCCIAESEEWRVESDLRTLTEAATIRKDKTRMKKVRELARRKIEEVAAVSASQDGQS